MRMEELSEESRVSPRNIRKYISLGLLPPPIGRTRSASYTAAHLSDLLQIRSMLARDPSLARAKEVMEAKRLRLLGVSGEQQQGALVPLMPVHLPGGGMVLLPDHHDVVQKHLDFVAAGFQKVLEKARVL